MIHLTRLNGTELIVNNDLVKTIEATPDTTLTLINGEKLMVKEPIDTVLERIIAFRQRVLPPVERAMEL
jgi:flagellar protein FlbD